MTYISLFRHPIQISTVQSEEQHVVKHLQIFHLNRTVNEAGNVGLRKLHRLEKSMAPGGMKLASGGSCSTKSTKNSIFRESEHYASLVWRLAANRLPPGGSCCSRNPEILPAPANLIPTPTILIPFDFRLHTPSSSV